MDIFIRQECLNDNVITEDDTKKKEISTIETLLDENTSMVDSTSIISDETSLNNVASWSVWYHLFTASSSGIFGLCLLVVLLLLGEALSDGTNYWLRVWLAQSNVNEQGSPTFAYIYFGLIIATIVADAMRTNYFYSIILSGSNQLHNNMLKGLLYTSVQFFESNPSGRILNRASKDQHIIDELLPITLLNWSHITVDSSWFNVRDLFVESTCSSYIDHIGSSRIDDHSVLSPIFFSIKTTGKYHSQSCLCTFSNLSQWLIKYSCI